MKTLILLLLFFSASTILCAQTQEATTKSGKKVVLYADGTWKYADETKPVEQIPASAEKNEKPKKVVKPAEIKTTAVPENCEEFFETIEEKKSGVTTVRTKNMIIVAEENSSKEIDILLSKNSKGIITLTVKPVGAGNCIGDGNKVNIVYEDGSKTELNHDGFPNCNGEITISFGANYGKKKQLEELSSKKIKLIKAWTQKGTVQEIFSVQNQDDFLKAINCLTKN